MRGVRRFCALIPLFFLALVASISLGDEKAGRKTASKSSPSAATHTAPIPARCPNDPNRNVPGALCEDFDTDRNGIPGFQWSRLPLGPHPFDSLLAIGDPNDDIFGYTIHGGPIPLGTGAVTCASDVTFPNCSAPVAEENDWHLHSPHEGPGDGYTPPGSLEIGETDGGKAHSGLRSMHMGRHTDERSTIWDALRFRQVSAFVLDSQGDPNINGIVPGPGTTLEFWHLISIPDDENFGSGFVDPGESFGGGQLHISLQDGSGDFGPWRRLEPTFNGYDSLDQDGVSLCGFDPGDDFAPPADESFCNNDGRLWADIGDVFGTDASCTTDTDGNDPDHLDCGDISDCTGGPGCTENGSIGDGVWARSEFDLSPFAGRTARLRWIGMMEGGWSFGVDRSVIESATGIYNLYGEDDGWWIDDIALTDLRTEPQQCSVDSDLDGTLSCVDDCNDNEADVYPGAPDLCDGLNNDCNHPDWPSLVNILEVDDDSDSITECLGDCDDSEAAVYPGAPEICDGFNNDCNDLDWPDVSPADEDLDLDGVLVCENDCDDSEADIHPGAAQICDGLNNDCDHPSWPGLADTTETDDDLDTLSECAGDCDDAAAGIFPGAPQACDGLNNDCNHPSWPSVSGTNEADDDSDSLSECAGDCDDGSSAVYPGAPQICDGVNNDCNDASWPSTPANESDADADTVRICAGDCDDSVSSVYPDAPQICDGVNNDCNDAAWPTAPANESDTDGDTVRICAGDCDDSVSSIYPGAPDICDGLNNDCSDPLWPQLTGTNDADDDTDSLSECSGDCDDADLSVFPGAPQICDGINNDCNDASWPTIPASEADSDTDGHIICAGDCDDTNDAVYPGAPELCDGINNNCNHPAWPDIPSVEQDSDLDTLAPCAGDCDDTQVSVYPGAPQNCGDSLNNDCSHPSWPALTATNEFDDDSDGLNECQLDCNDGDGTAWAIPDKALELTLEGRLDTLLTWTQPASSGGSVVHYDVVRSLNPTNFVSGIFLSCVETDDTDTQATDSTLPPGGSFFYLIRAHNSCDAAGTIGTGTGGAPRIVRSCP